MKAIVKRTKGPGLSLEDKPVPKISENEVLIKIKKTAICGTDLHIDQWTPWAAKTLSLPTIIGHEFMGEIAEVGQQVKHLKKGQRVSGEGHITCGHCHNCRTDKRHLCPFTQGIGIQRDGAFAEFLSLPAENVITIPDTISDEIATIFDPLGNAVHTSLAFDLIGENVLITGAGPIGLMAAKIAHFIGVKRVVITDINPYRLNIAKKMGVDLIVNLSEESLTDALAKNNSKSEFTVGLEMSGKEEALHTQLDNLYPGADLALLGIPAKPLSIELSKIIFKGLTLKGIYGRKIFQTWDKMINLLESGLDVSPIITHQFNAQDFEQAFAVVQKGEACKVILNWT